ncbi:zinc ribbon domain-containing protein [Nonomuraea sp. NPDC049480]|uniref:zinc ribbon domain-containing protein n=1 Tax=Nonomuraea sp. NPDC049480 TaxID=3364353 RepID=UPI0037AC7032
MTAPQIPEDMGRILPAQEPGRNALEAVDQGRTSQQCSHCGHVDKNNRPDQETFTCTSCGFAEHADVNAARNIASRGAAGWAVSHAA